MIIENQAMVTDAVLEAVNRTEEPRLRQILLALVRHLHGFVREVRLSESEFQQAVRIITAMGQKTTASHNEVVLMAARSGYLRWSACSTTATMARPKPRPTCWARSGAMISR
jgi:Catechol dioxygenase N terminus